MKRSPYHTPRFLKMKSELLRCVVVVLLMSGVVLRASDDYTDTVSCPVDSFDSCGSIAQTTNCCVERTFTVDENGNRVFISSELVWDRPCLDKDVTPARDTALPADAGTPIPGDQACTTCSLAPSDPAYTGADPQGNPSNLGDSLTQIFSLGTEMVESSSGTEFTEVPVGTVSVDLEPGPLTIPDPVDPQAPEVLNAITVDDVKSFVTDLSSGPLPTRSGLTPGGRKVKQFLAPQALFIFTESVEGSMYMEVYKISDVIFSPEPGLHAAAEGKRPSTFITFARFEEPVSHENFIRSYGMSNGRYFSRTVGGTVNADGSGGNLVELKDGLRIETVHTYIKAPVPGQNYPDYGRPDLAALAAEDADQNIHMETITTSKGDWVAGVLSWVPTTTKVRVFQTLMVNKKEVVLEESTFISGAGGVEELTTRNTYEDDFVLGSGPATTVNKAYGQLSSRENPDGSWVLYDYDMVTGMAWRIYRPWLGTPATLAEAKALSTPEDRKAACHVEEYLYSSGDPLEEVGKLVTIQGVPVAQQTKTLTENGTTRVKTTTTTRKRLAADGTGTETYQTTQVKTYTISGTGRATLVSQKNDDGTLTLYDAEPGDFDPATGVFTHSPTGVYHAETVIGPALAGGQTVPGQTRKQVTITNEVGQRLLESTAIATNGEVAAAAQYDVFDGRKYIYDAESRLTTTTTLDGTVVEDVTYVDYPSGFTRTVKDASGVVTQIPHDVDGNELYRTRLVLTDGTDTIGPDGAQTYLSVAPNSNRTVETRWAYGVRTITTKDVAGRVVERTDQQGRVTTYEYAKATVDGHAIYRVTETLPNGATRISERYIDGHLRSITGTGVVAEHHVYAVNEDRTTTETVHTGAADGARWVSVTREGTGGAVLKEVKPSPAGGAATVSTLSFHDDFGRLVRTSRPGLGDQITEYDSIGNVAARGVDMNGNHVLDRSGTDVLTEFIAGISASAGHGDETQTTRTYTTDGSATVLIRTVVRRLGCGGTCSSQVTTTEPDGTVRTEITTINRTTGLKTVTRKETRPGSGEQTLGTQRYLAGFLVRETLAGVNGDIVHEYGWGGRVKTTDPRSGIQRWIYAGMTRLLESTSTGPEEDLKTTSYAYYPATGPMAGELQTITHPGGAFTTREYDLLGRQTYEGGSATYAVKYQYDELGQRTTMRTRRNAATQVNDGDWDTTTWAWQPGTGKLESKTDAAGKAVTYTYDAAGQLHTRIWARKEEAGTADLVTTYAYDAAGRLTGTDYSDDTPDVAITLDRAGRAAQITDASGTRTSTYDGPGGALSTIGYSGADSPLAGLAVNYGFDDNKRRSSVSVMQGAATLSTTGYTYQDTSGRIATVSHGGQSATYDWTTQVAGLPGTVTYSGTGITGTLTPDAHGRLDDITWRQGADAASPLMLKNDYTLDDRGRRTAATRENSQYNWTYGYNDRSEVTSGARTGEQFVYQYDEIGNRTQATAPLAQTNSYASNALNQYSAITNPDPGRRKVKGTANPWVRVTVKQTLEGQQPPAAPVTLGQFGPSSSGAATGFSTSVSAPTTSGPAWLKVGVEGSRTYMGYNGQTLIWARPDHLPVVYKKESGFYFPPKAESLTYDEDGNLVLDGRWTWAWDAENRLKSMETTAAAAAAGVPRQRLEFVYDSQSRRVRKVVKSFSSTTNGFVVTSDTRFLYDGWNVIAEFEASPSLPVSSSPRLAASYAWGLDLSGTETGAGGVGGLLLVSLYNNSSTTANNVQQLQTTAAPCYDGNGNVLAYAVCSTSQVLARYEYDPFGKLLIKDEDASVAGRLHHQFSTKYMDEETGLCDYGYRYYSAELGRWVNRDPIEEQGGTNLYAMTLNSAVTSFDRLGLDCCSVKLAKTALTVSQLDGPEPGPADVVASGILAVAAGISIGSAIAAGIEEIVDCTTCPPCPFAKGGGSRVDYVPPSRPHWPCTGDHTHVWWFEMRQEPWPFCTCHENKVEWVKCNDTKEWHKN